MEKVKKMAKYGTNILAFINALILVLDPIWGIPMADKISATIIGITGVIGVYLLGDKAITTKRIENINLDEIEVDELSKENNIGINEDEDIMIEGE